jgi:hypothetical protein
MSWLKSACPGERVYELASHLNVIGPDGRSQFVEKMLSEWSGSLEPTKE